MTAAGYVRQDLWPGDRVARSDFLLGGERKAHIDLLFSATEQRVAGLVHFGPLCEGPPGLVHGGAISTVADVTLALLPYWCKRWAVTASLTVNYKRPVPLLSTLLVTSAFRESQSDSEAAPSARKMTLDFTLTRLEEDGAPSGRPLCTAEGLFVIPEGGPAHLHKSAA